MTINSFKDLIVWQKSINLVKEVYQLSRSLPKSEIFGLVSQMQRAAVSIPSNIAEGSKRKTRNDYVQFLRITSGSVAELETQLIILKDVYPESNVETVTKLILEIEKMLTVMISKLEL
jgi:four helix bundle protein